MSSQSRSTRAQVLTGVPFVSSSFFLPPPSFSPLHSHGDTGGQGEGQGTPIPLSLLLRFHWTGALRGNKCRGGGRGTGGGGGGQLTRVSRDTVRRRQDR